MDVPEATEPKIKDYMPLAMHEFHAGVLLDEAGQMLSTASYLENKAIADGEPYCYYAQVMALRRSADSLARKVAQMAGWQVWLTTRQQCISFAREMAVG